MIFQVCFIKKNILCIIVLIILVGLDDNMLSYLMGTVACVTEWPLTQLVCACLSIQVLGPDMDYMSLLCVNFKSKR